MYGESNLETYITVCKIDSQWEWLRELKQGLCINLGGWEGEEWDELGEWIDTYTLLCIK